MVDVWNAVVAGTVFICGDIDGGDAAREERRFDFGSCLSFVSALMVFAVGCYALV